MGFLIFLHFLIVKNKINADEIKSKPNRYFNFVSLKVIKSDIYFKSKQYKLQVFVVKM